MATFNFDAEKRTPWNNIIRPGNWVTHLNAYRDQGVTALPGANFFRLVGALVLNPDIEGNLVDGELPAGTYDLKILSPDLRGDDKPRLDRPFEVPAGARIYRTAISAPGVREGDSLRDPSTGELPGSTTITIDGPATPTPPVATANDGTTPGRDGEVGFYNPVGEFSDPLLSILDTAATGDILDPEDTLAIQVTTDAALTARQNPSAGACRKSPSAILVEVCFWLPDAAPDADDVHLPYGVEAGQGY